MLQLLLVDPKKLAQTDPLPAAASAAGSNGGVVSPVPALPAAACEELTRVATTVAMLLDKQFVDSSGAASPRGSQSSAPPKRGDPCVFDCVPNEATSAKASNAALSLLYATEVAVFVPTDAANTAAAQASGPRKPAAAANGTPSP